MIYQTGLFSSSLIIRHLRISRLLGLCALEIIHKLCYMLESSGVISNLYLLTGTAVIASSS